MLLHCCTAFHPGVVHPQNSTNPRQNRGSSGGSCFSERHRVKHLIKTRYSFILPERAPNIKAAKTPLQWLAGITSRTYLTHLCRSRRLPFKPVRIKRLHSHPLRRVFTFIIPDKAPPSQPPHRTPRVSTSVIPGEINALFTPPNCLAV